MDTLLYNGLELPLGPASGLSQPGKTDWGLCADLNFDLVNKSASVCRARTIESFDTQAPLFAIKGRVTIFLNRNSVGNGGSALFAGFVSDITRETSEGRENIRYTFSDLW